MNHVSSPDLERHLLGVLIEDQNILNAALERGLSVDCFSLTNHRRLFEEILSLREKRVPADFFTLSESCDHDPEIIALIADCADGCVIEFSHCMTHVGILQAKAKLRRLMRLGAWLQSGAAEVGADPSLLAQTAVSAITEGRVL